MIHLTVLGTLDVRGEGAREPERLLRQPKRAALLAYLAAAMPRGGFHRRDRLLALFWPELDDAHARGALNASLRFLRRALADDLIVSRGQEEIALDPHLIDTDAHAFRSAIAERRFEDAVALYGGDLLDGYHLSGAHGFEEWLEQERSALRRMAVLAASQLAERTLGQSPGTAVSWARRAAALAPDDERIGRRLIEILDAAGDRLGALETYHELARRLAEEYDAAPSAETLALAQRLRAGNAVPIARPRPVAVPDADQSERTPRAVHRGRNARLIAVAAVLLLLVGTAALRGWSGGDDPPRSTDDGSTVVAVFPFVTADRPEHDYLGAGLATLLVASLDAAGTLRVVDLHALRNRLPSGEETPTLRTAQVIASTFGAGFLILGDVVQAADRLIVSAEVFAIGNDARAIDRAMVEGPRDSLQLLVSRLGRELLDGLETGFDPRLAGPPAPESTSFAALSAWLEGEHLLAGGHYRPAARAYERALAADTGFAAAWYGLATVGTLVTTSVPYLAAVDSAMRYRDELPRRDRLMIEGRHAFLHGDGVTARERALEAIELAPDHAEAWHLLASADGWLGWQRGRDRTRARAAVERALELNPRSVPLHHQMVEQEMRARRYVEAESLGRVAYLQGRQLTNIEASVRAASAVGRVDTAAIGGVLRELLDHETITVWNAAAYVAIYTDDLRSAERFARLLTDSTRRASSARATGHLLMALARLAGGRRRAADSAFADLTRTAPELALVYRAWFAVIPDLAVPDSALRALRDEVRAWNGRGDRMAVGWFEMPWAQAPELRVYLLGILAARLGERDEALRHADVLEQSTTDDPLRVVPDLAREIRALVAMGDGDPVRALALLEQMTLEIRAHYDVSTPLNLRPLGRYLRARLLDELGHDEQALGWYEAFAQFVGPEFVFQAPAWLRAAEIHEKLGRRARANEYYSRFVARWHDADRPLQAEVDRARRGVRRTRD